MIDWTVEKTHQFQGTIDNKKILLKTIVASNCMCQWYQTENLVPTPRKSEEEEDEIDLDPEQLTTITQKERNVSQARGDSMLKFTANRETLIHSASEHPKCARTVDIGQF